MSDTGRLAAAEQRRERILAQLSARGRLSVAEISQRCGVSEVTARKDLDALEAQGMLIRVHGGAVLTGRGQIEQFFAAREHEGLEAKRRIAQAAAALIRSGQRLFLDASTTAFQIARLIKEHQELTVVTNGLYTALELAPCQGITVIVAGGVVRHRSSSLVGGLNSDMIQRLRVDIGFFGARGVTAADGLTETDLGEAQLKHQMVRASQVVVGVADSSKFGQVHLHSFALPHEIDRVISDAAAPEEIVAALREREIVVELV
ncbi:MAG TPA: DeoR/GlpR family DNA-binding transcription regulator [Roseiflexaceae bacterium]|nr:DeoR/GlpR family DNA-binding transcription regulator [Roseiflexaceae bacterium]